MRLFPSIHRKLDVLFARSTAVLNAIQNLKETMMADFSNLNRALDKLAAKQGELADALRANGEETIKSLAVLTDALEKLKAGQSDDVDQAAVEQAAARIEEMVNNTNTLADSVKAETSAIAGALPKADAPKDQAQG